MRSKSLNMRKICGLKPTKVSEFEEKKRILDKQLEDEISKLPNFPSKDAPFGTDENNNIQIKNLNFKYKVKT